MRSARITFSLLASFLLLGAPLFVFAQQEYVSLTRIPGITDFTDATSLVNGFIRLAMVAAGLLAVLQIVRGGFTYLTTEAVSAKGEAKKLISDALTGLLLVLVSVTILTVINPDILNVRFFSSESSFSAPAAQETTQEDSTQDSTVPDTTFSDMQFSDDSLGPRPELEQIFSETRNRTSCQQAPSDPRYRLDRSFSYRADTPQSCNGQTLQEGQFCCIYIENTPR